MKSKVQIQLCLRNVYRALFSMVLTGLIVTSLSVEVAVSAANKDGWSGHTATMIDRNGEVLEDGAQSVHPQDSLALVAIYESMRGDTWINNTGWLSDMVVNWEGLDQVEEIEVEPGVFEWRVTRLRFFAERHNMTQCGYLPPEIGDLEYLYRFRIIHQHVCGEIPHEFFDIEDFGRLRFQNTYMTGEIPWDLIAESDLDRFFPYYNHFTGPAPTDDIAGAELERLQIDGNASLTGSISQEVANMESLVRFYANKLPNVTGPMPNFENHPNIERIEMKYVNFDPAPFPEWVRTLGGFEGINYLALSESNIEGPVPDWIVEMTNMREMHIGGRLMGMPMDEFPDLSMLPGMDRFALVGGDFTGELPPWFADMENLNRLWIHGTQIGGTLDVLAGLTNMSYLRLDNNNFEGGIPAAFQQMDNLSALGLANNNMDIGDIPDYLAQNNPGLSLLNLANSGVTGEIPASLQQLDNLQLINLSHNPDLGGTIPSWIWDFDLLQFDISYTGIDVGGVIPPEIEQQGRRFRKLGLAGLGISGPIPEWLGNMEFLRDGTPRTDDPYISLADNELSGPIPANFGPGFWGLDSLNLANNQLEGGIEMFAMMGRPDPERETVARLQAFDVSGNADLTGEIPAEMMNNHKTRVFNVEGTDLCMPSGFNTYLYGLIANESQGLYAYVSVDEYYGGEPYVNINAPADIGFCPGVTSADPIEHAGEFRLHKNYPNPFNPTTTIRYEIPNESHVTLTVYNVLGQRVATLVNETISAGAHEVHFDAEHLSSGSYIYRLQAGQRVTDQTMMLVK